VLAPGAQQALADLALRLSRGGRWPMAIDTHETRDGLGDEMLRLGFDNVLVHGTGPTSGGGSVFLLFGLASRPTARHAYFLELLLPHLHLALERLPAARTVGDGAPARALSARETEIIGWLRAGKSNDEMGRLLGISGLTVKNHLQRIYRTLGVNNRAHALARCMDLRLLERDQDCGASAAARRMAS
jgi:DNA-binding CsgD family transcriptional regulator